MHCRQREGNEVGGRFALAIIELFTLLFPRLRCVLSFCRRCPPVRGRGRFGWKTFAAYCSLAGCATAPPCGSVSHCAAAGSVCDFDGRCRPLSPPDEARFARSRWLSARDWAPVHRGAAHLGRDVFELGGPARGEILLKFGPLPPPGDLLRALLVLTPEPAQYVPVGGRVEVYRSQAFVGRPHRRRFAPPTVRGALVARAVEPGPAPLLRLDVSRAARSAARPGRDLYLAVRFDGEAPLRFASPLAFAARMRPRLELLLQSGAESRR